MQKPIQITERGLDLPEATKDHILRRAEELEKYDDRMTSCHVICEAPHRHQGKGVQYEVRIEVGVPGRTLSVNRQHQEDLNAAIREAFDAARREVEDAVREREGRVKQSSGGSPMGKVVRIFPEKGYGFIESEDGSQIYFHRNSVLHGAFGKLHVGAEVHFSEEMGEKVRRPAWFGRLPIDALRKEFRSVPNTTRLTHD